MGSRRFLFPACLFHNFSPTATVIPAVVFSAAGTVTGMESFRADQVAAVLARSRCVRRGVIACSSLDAEDALHEMELVLAAGLVQCRHLLASCSCDDPQLGVLLTAERYWMEALMEIVSSSDADPAQLVDEVLRSLPDDD